MRCTSRPPWATAPRPSESVRAVCVSSASVRPPGILYVYAGVMLMCMYVCGHPVDHRSALIPMPSCV